MNMMNFVRSLTSFTIVLVNFEITFAILKFWKNDLGRRKTIFPDKLIAYLYSKMVGFRSIDKVKGIPLSKKFVQNMLGIRDGTYVLHHSHIMGELIDFAHSYCNWKDREKLL